MRESLVAGLKRVTEVKVMSHGHTWECCDNKTQDICIIQLSHPYITTGKTVAVMCGCESWTIKKAEHRRIDAFELRKTQFKEKTLESPLDCKEIQPVHPKGDQSRVFIGRTDAEAETPICWPPDVKK